MLQDFVAQVENVCKDVVNAMIHTAMPGKIITVDTGTGMAVVKPSGMYKTQSGKALDYPSMTGVPILMPQCQSLGIEVAFPVKAGDSCLIIISEQELDAWLYNQESDCELKFDLSNAICIPGLSSVGGAAFREACSNGTVVIANGKTKLTVSKNDIAISGNLTVKGNISYTGTLSGP